MTKISQMTLKQQQAVTQAAQAQNENTIDLYHLRYKALYGNFPYKVL